MKTFHELNESFPSLLDENGDRKPFERFLNDVRKVDETYNANYLRSEYNFIHASAAMAAKWEQYQEDGDRYYLQYRTAGDDRVRPEHAALEGVTLPMDDPFWEEYFPPNSWGCRCSAVQVRKSKYPKTDHDEAMRLGELATGQDTRGMFRFNPGKQQKAVPDYNPYTIRQCRTCPVARGEGKENLAAFIPQSDLCQACQLVRSCVGDREKSQAAIQRKHYVDKEMAPLLRVKHEKPIPDGYIKVGFTKYGNKHLYSDTYGRSAVLQKEDLKNLGDLLKRSSYEDDAQLSHERNDNITHFYYYSVRLRSNTVYLNVAKEEENRNGQIRITYYLYSVTDSIR